MAPPKSLAHSQRLKRCGEWTRHPDLVVVVAEDDVEAEAAGEAEGVVPAGMGKAVEDDAAGEVEKVEVVVGGVITVAVVAKVTWRGRPQGL
jgi:hypothetical protein